MALWIIVILLAAILVTLLGAWKAVPSIIAGVVSFAMWLFLVGIAWHVFGEAGLWSVLALPFMAAAVLWLIATREDRSEKSAALKSPPKQVPDWERNESASRRAELNRLREDIESRSTSN